MSKDELDPEDIRQLSGTPLPSEQDALVAPEEIESERQLTDTERYEAEPEVSDAPDDMADLLADRDLREGETDDPNVAAEEGLTYVPPTDPPVVPGAGEDIEIAAGFGSTSLDEPYDDDHAAEPLTPESEISARVREAIRADAETSRYADEVVIASVRGVVLLRGAVDGIEDVDALTNVAAEVDGVVEVRDELEVAGL